MRGDAAESRPTPWSRFQSEQAGNGTKEENHGIADALILLEYPYFLLFIRTLGISPYPTIVSPVSDFLGRSASLAHASAAFGLGNQGMGLGVEYPMPYFCIENHGMAS